ncbi:MAG: cytochrome C oxidase subunit IV family protein [Candidatus Saccharibacteria bacterium]|nr:cytochrome C oxidase subunit IV family protein [Candidatus Saccharibacteria bacterium]
MKETQHAYSPTKEHNPTASYVIGFVLSLFFTLIPYSLVVNKTVTGNVLIATILGFAIIQMLVQIFFFLHLGRGPKPFYNIVFFVATVGLILVTVGGSIFIMNNLYSNMSVTDITTKLAQKEGIAQIGDQPTGACQGRLQNHQVIIKDGVMNPATTKAKRCDTLTISNQDAKDREIAFGEHPEHSAYGGEEEVLVRAGYNKTITLNQTGEYIYHDHFEPETAGFLIVEP